LQSEDFHELSDESKRFKSLLSLMEVCLRINPSTRPTATQVLEALKAIESTGIWVPQDRASTNKQQLADLMSWPSPTKRDTCAIKSTDHLRLSSSLSLSLFILL